MYSAGEVVGSIGFGSMGSTRLGIKWSLVMATLIHLVGCYFYATAVEGWMALLGRILNGIFAGAVNASVRSYITKSTKKENIIKDLSGITFGEVKNQMTLLNQKREHQTNHASGSLMSIKTNQMSENGSMAP